MKATAHSALPWTVTHGMIESKDGPVAILCGPAVMWDQAGAKKREANIEHILVACNHFDELVQALEAIHENLPHVGVAGTVKGMRDVIEHVLAKVKGASAPKGAAV